MNTMCIDRKTTVHFCITWLLNTFKLYKTKTGCIVLEIIYTMDYKCATIDRSYSTVTLTEAT